MFSLQPRVPEASLFGQAQLSTQADVVAQTTHARDNLRIAERMALESELLRDGSRRGLDFALSNHAASYSSACGVGLSPATVDLESQLLRPGPAPEAAPRGDAGLNRRPINTVPYMARGSVDPTLESRIRTGVRAVQHKSPDSLPDASTASSAYQTAGQDMAFGRAPLPLGDNVFGPASRLGSGGLLYEEASRGLPRTGINTRTDRWTDTEKVATSW